MKVFPEALPVTGTELEPEPVKVKVVAVPAVSEKPPAFAGMLKIRLSEFTVTAPSV